MARSPVKHDRKCRRKPDEERAAGQLEPARQAMMGAYAQAQIDLAGTEQKGLSGPQILTASTWRITMSDMKTSILTIRLDPDLDALLARASRRSGRNRSEIARDALRRQLRIYQFESLRQRTLPLAEARGYLTDEDVFAAVS